MDQRERHRSDSSPDAATPEDDQLDNLRQDTSRMLDAGDQAIARALSRNSAAFLHANRQRGGQ
jgi:hypothetical protein